MNEQLHYIIELDGDKWCAHYNDFTNIQDTDEFAFGDTPQNALQSFIDSRDAVMNGGKHISSNEFSGLATPSPQTTTRNG